MYPFLSLIRSVRLGSSVFRGTWKQTEVPGRLNTREIIVSMRRVFLVSLVIGTLWSCSNHHVSPADTDQQQGNPNAHPETHATAPDTKQPGDNQAGRDPHTGAAASKH
jgi:hypothetical protein